VNTPISDMFIICYYLGECPLFILGASMSTKDPKTPKCASMEALMDTGDRYNGQAAKMDL